MKPCKRRDFIKKLRRLDFDGPYSGSKHQFMIKENRRLSIPSNNEYSVPQLKMMIKEIQSILNRIIQDDDWENL